VENDFFPDIDGKTRLKRNSGNKTAIMTFPFTQTQSAPKPPTHIRDMQDVWDHFACQAPDPSKPKMNNPEGWRLQYLTKLQSNCGGAPLAVIFPGNDLLAEFDAAFPKVKKGVHPRPDLRQTIGAYKAWRRQSRRAIEIATGVAAEKAELRAREDGWAELLAAIKLHCTDGGIVHHAAASPVTSLADIARRGCLEPWHLADDGILDRLEAAFSCPHDLDVIRRAQRFLNDFACIPEIAAVLPTQPVPIFSPRRVHADLPERIDTFVEQLIERAAGTRDEVSGQDSDGVSTRTRERWRAALRHHLRSLPHCPAEPELGYTAPITNLEAINNVASLFARGHLYATLRRSNERTHLPDTISLRTIYHYYSDIMRVLWASNPEVDIFGDPVDPNAPWLIDAKTHRAMKSSKIMKEGKELANGMTEANEVWCQNLVKDKARRKRFRNMHRTMMSAANSILEGAEAEGRALTGPETRKVRQLGTCAAASAIEWSGRPIRMGNVLGLRLHGMKRNFHTPTPGRPTYAFTLFADETKSGKDEPETPLSTELHGPQVLAWYLAKVRPLFPHQKKSIYLFPSVQTPGKQLGHKTFDIWFQRAATEAGLPMTFHQWRHGYASLLLDADWSNLPDAAQMLGNTPGVCERNYAWINKERLILEAQAKIITAIEADE
jgi:hypothetical protein